MSIALIAGIAVLVLIVAIAAVGRSRPRITTIEDRKTITDDPEDRR